MNDTAEADALSDWLERFSVALSSPQTVDWNDVFTENASWRDLVAVTWTILTVEGREGIVKMAREQLPAIGLGQFNANPKGLPPADQSGGWFTFETNTARGKAYVTLEAGKASFLLTAMVELKGFEERLGPTRIRGVAYGAERNRKTWLDERMETAERLGTEEQPYCVVVGGGQNGLMLAARLKQLHVPTLVIESQPAIGDAWRTRYRSLYLHGPSHNDHFPYLPYPTSWPLYPSKDKIGDWLEVYAKAMELDVWTSTRLTRARYDEAKGEWQVTVDRGGEPVTLRPKQLVLATGLSGAPYTPHIDGMEEFRGLQYHSSRHGDLGSQARGKKCVVIGANNSAHDIAQDQWEHEAASVTMIQRSPAIVIKITTSEVLRKDSPWSNYDLKTEDADLIGSTVTYRKLTELEKGATKAFNEYDADFYKRLGDAGFLLTDGQDGTGLFIEYFRRAGGYYIDVGASELVAAGEIKIKQGEIGRIVPEGVELESGEVLPADILVYATGYHPLEDWVGELIGRDVQAKIGRCWGFGSGTREDPGPWEGELRNMWKPTAQQGLWFQGGAIQQARFHSLHTALQIKARMEGIHTPVYQPEMEAVPA